MWRKTDKLNESQRLFLNQAVVSLATVYHYEGVVRFNISVSEKNIFKKVLKIRLKTLKQIESGQPQTQDVAMANIESFGLMQMNGLLMDTRMVLDLYDDAILMAAGERALLIKKLADIILKISESSPLELDAEEFRELCSSFYKVLIGDFNYSEGPRPLNDKYLEALDTLVSAFKNYCDITDFDERDLTIWTTNKLKIYNKYGTFGYN